MIVINECRITEDGSCLLIEAQVNNLIWYKNVYIGSVIVDTDETWVPEGPSLNPVYRKDYEAEYPKVDVYEDCNSVTTDEECKCGNVYASQKSGVKKIRISLKKKDLKVADLDSNIFFVYIMATGIPDPGTPCGMDKIYTCCAAVNLRPIYNKTMAYIKEMDRNCQIPKGFIDMILRLKAFKIALKTGHYQVAFEHWRKLFRNKIPVSKTGSKCGCHGSY